MYIGADKSTGFVVLTLKDGKRDPIDKVMQELNVKFFRAHGWVWSFWEAMPLMNLSAGGESTAQGSKYSYLMRGNDRDKLYETAQKLQQAMSQLPGFVGIQTSVKLNLPQLNVILDRDRASTYGISSQDILNALMASLCTGKGDHILHG